jgi:14-3-3 protein beta/theta/zeta
LETDDTECQSFFLKLAGDYYRYMSEMARGELLSLSRNCAYEHYKQADKAARDLHACNSIKLGIALNFSVFQHEVMKETNKAIQLAESALQEAHKRIEDVDEETFRDAKSVLELLRDNLLQWKREEAGDKPVDEDELV